MTTRRLRVFDAPLKPVEIIPELNITSPAPWRSSVGWRKRDPRFERLWRSTQTSPSRASMRAQGVTTRAIWRRVSDYATASAKQESPNNDRRPPRSSDFDLSPISTPWSRVGADRGSNTTPIHTPRAQRSIRSRAAATWAAQERG
jgi:hypothetical protein